MCYFCMEIHPLTLAADLSQEKPVDLNDVATFDEYLQEGPNLQLALTVESAGLQHLLNELDKIEKDKKYIYNSGLDVIFCRTMQVLLTKGFDSAEYQTLISHPIVKRIVKYAVKRPIQSDDPFPLAPAIISIFHYRTFTEKSTWDTIINNPALVSDCNEFINAYLNLYSNENIKPKRVLDRMQKYFPCMFFASILVALRSPESEALHRLIIGEEMGFDPAGLWCQRQIFLVVYDAFGLTPFLPFRDVVRAGLIYYLVARKKLTDSEKEILKKEILASKFYTSYLEMRETEEYKENPTKKPTPFHIFLEPYLLEYL